MSAPAATNSQPAPLHGTGTLARPIRSSSSDICATSPASSRTRTPTARTRGTMARGTVASSAIPQPMPTATQSTTCSARKRSVHSSAPRTPRFDTHRHTTSQRTAANSTAKRMNGRCHRRGLASGSAGPRGTRIKARAKAPTRMSGNRARMRAGAQYLGTSEEVATEPWARRIPSSEEPRRSTGAPPARQADLPEPLVRLAASPVRPACSPKSPAQSASSPNEETPSFLQARACRLRTVDGLMPILPATAAELRPRRRKATAWASRAENPPRFARAAAPSSRKPILGDTPFPSHGAPAPGRRRDTTGTRTAPSIRAAAAATSLHHESASHGMSGGHAQQATQQV